MEWKTSQGSNYKLVRAESGFIFGCWFTRRNWWEIILSKNSILSQNLSYNVSNPHHGYPFSTSDSPHASELESSLGMILQESEPWNCFFLSSFNHLFTSLVMRSSSSSSSSTTAGSAAAAFSAESLVSTFGSSVATQLLSGFRSSSSFILRSLLNYFSFKKLHFNLLEKPRSQTSLLAKHFFLPKIPKKICFSP